MELLAEVTDLRRLTGAAWADELGARSALQSASALVRGHCGWGITSETGLMAELDSDGSDLLDLPTLNLTEVIRVTVRGHELSEVDYQWSRAGQLHRSWGHRWPRGFRAVEVTYSGGWDQVPAELVALVCSVANRLSMPAGVTSMAVGGTSVTYGGGNAGVAALVELEERALDRFTLPKGA